MVVVADGTDEAAERLERVLTTDPGHRRAASRRRGLRRGARGRRASTGSSCRCRRRRRVTTAPATPRLLVRDLAQLATPPGRRRAAARRRRSREVEVVEDAYVLCEGGPIAAVGTMRDLRPLDGDVEELDGAGLCAIPGLVDCHTHACFRRRPRRGVRAARRRRELRGAARRRRRDPLDRPGDARRRRGGAARAPSSVTATGCCAPARRPSRASPATGSTARPSSPRCGRSRPRAASRHGSARTRCRRSSPTRTRTSTSRSPRCCPRRRELAEAADVFLERGAFDVAAGAPLPGGVPRAPASRCASTATSSPSGRGPARDRARRAVGRPPRGDGRGRGRARSPRSDVTAVLLPASALFLGRPMPPARALVDAGAAVALATDFNPGSAFCESLPLVCSLACTQLQPLAGRGAGRLHGQRGARARARRAVGRLAPGYAADLVLLDAPDWRYLAYHLGGDLVATVIRRRRGAGPLSA